MPLWLRKERVWSSQRTSPLLWKAGCGESRLSGLDRGKGRKAYLSVKVTLVLQPQEAVRASGGFVEGLRALGYVEGTNILLEYGSGAGHIEQLRTQVPALVRRGVHVIVTRSPLATRAARDMAGDFDPIGDGFVASLGHPGGNITGVTVLSRELTGKRLELLKDTVRGMVRVAVVWNPTEVSGARQLQDTEDAARVLGLQMHALAVRGLGDFAGAFAAARAGGAEGLIVRPALAVPSAALGWSRSQPRATRGRGQTGGKHMTRGSRRAEVYKRGVS